MKWFPREKYLRKIRAFYHAADLMKVITGVHGCGKTTLLLTIGEELREQGVPEERILYFDFGLRRYRRIRTADQLEELIASGIQDGEQYYLFLDGMPDIPGFEEVLNGFREDGNCSIFLAGSNASLMDGEQATKLTGRYIEFELYTLTFEEYERMKAFYEIPVNPDPQVELASYLREGGFPGAVRIQNPDEKRRYTEGILQQIFEKEIRKRMKIRNREGFQTVSRYLIRNFGTAFSIFGLQKDLEKNGQKVSRKTLERYLDALLDAKVLYACRQFDMRSRRFLENEKKYYLGDMSFFSLMEKGSRIPCGPALENIVYLYACSMDEKVRAGRVGRWKCDFIMRSAPMHCAYVQTAYTIGGSRESEDQAYRPLERIRDNYPKYVVTTDLVLQERNGIQHVNLQDFMLQGKVF